MAWNGARDHHLPILPALTFRMPIHVIHNKSTHSWREPLFLCNTLVNGFVCYSAPSLRPLKFSSSSFALFFRTSVCRMEIHLVHTSIYGNNGRTKTWGNEIFSAVLRFVYFSIRLMPSSMQPGDGVCVCVCVRARYKRLCHDSTNGKHNNNRYHPSSQSQVAALRFNPEDLSGER